MPRSDHWSEITIRLETMKRLFRYIARTLSVRLSLTMAFSTAVLLMVSLAIVLQSSWVTVKQEALKNAAQTLESTTQQIDNILLTVEQSAGNVYWDMLAHLREDRNQESDERMIAYCRNLVEGNPNITGCAIAVDSFYYKHRSRKPFVYIYRASDPGSDSAASELKYSETFGSRPYHEQIWYTKPKETGRATWIGPLKEDQTEGNVLLTFSLPIYGAEGKPVGVMGVDVDLDQLSRIILSTKPSPNSYSTLLAGDGSYIVHPDSQKLKHQTVFSYYKNSNNQSIMDASRAMVSGKTGYTKFQQNGADYYVFYKPFHRMAVPGRTSDSLSWSAGIVYPEEDIFRGYNQMVFYGYAISLAGLLVLFVLIYLFTKKELLPLRLLTKSAQHIAQGNYDVNIPPSSQENEVGRLQDNFQRMQKWLAAHVSELEQLRASLLQQEHQLNAAYRKAQEADRMKTAFLHNMTDQMMAPANAIADHVARMRQADGMVEHEEAVRIEGAIQGHSNTITSLLSGMLNSDTQEENNENVSMP